MPTRVQPRRLNLKNRTRARGGRRAANPRQTCRRNLSNCIELASCGMKSRNRLESLSNDPIGFAAGDANLYRYTGNQPTTRTDPSGLDWLDDWFIDPVNGWFDANIQSPVDNRVDRVNNWVDANVDPIADAAIEGANDGAMVLADTITMGFDDRASQCADDAWKRAQDNSDWITQLGFYGSMAGGYATQSLVMPAPNGGGVVRIGLQPGGGLGVHAAWETANGAMHAGGVKPIWLLFTKDGRRYAAMYGMSLAHKLKLQTLSDSE